MEKVYTNTTDNQIGLGMELCSQYMDEVAQKAMGMVVYSSHLEKIASLVVIIITFIFTLIGQFSHFSVIITIVLCENLRQMPHFIVILTYCVADLVMVIPATQMYVWQYSNGCITLLPCRILSALALISALGIGNWICFMALERVVYFCYPMKYERHFSSRNMAIGIGIIFGVSGMYILSTELLIGRGYHASVMSCNLPSSSFQTTLQFLLFILPAAVITVVCVVKIWRLTKACSVAPARLNVAPSTSATQRAPSTNTTGGPTADACHAPSVLTTNPEPAHHSGDPYVPAAEGTNAGPAAIPVPGPATGQPPPGIPSQQVRKAFRMIMLVSGAYWGTILPPYIIRVCLVATGHTWTDLDARTYVTQALMMRLSTYIFSSISSLLNPIIYFYSRRDLRREFFRLLGIRPNAVGP